MSISVCVICFRSLEKLQSMPVVTLYHVQKKSFYILIKSISSSIWIQESGFKWCRKIITWLRLSVGKSASCSAIILICNLSQSSIFSSDGWVMKSTRLIVQHILVVSASSCIRAHFGTTRVVNSICFVQDILVRKLAIISPCVSSRWVLFPIDLTLKINICFKIVKYSFRFLFKINQI